MKAQAHRQRLVPWFQNAVVALAYLLTAKLGLLLALHDTNATAVWPPAGIALAACLVWGVHLWPGIFIGAFLANVTVLTSGPFPSAAVLAASLGTGAGNTLAAVAGVYLLSRSLSGRLPFNRAPDAIRFMLLGALVSTLISATIGAATFCLHGNDWLRFPHVWLTWWLGDAVGILVFAPLVLTWGTRGTLRRDTRRSIEAVTLLALFLLVEVIMFPMNFPLEYLVFPLLFWTAFRFGQFETAVTVALVMATFLVWTIEGFGPFAGTQLNSSLLFLQSYLGVAAASALLLSTLINSRNRAEEALRASEEKFRSIFERAPIGIFQSTSDGRFCSLNETLAAMFGYPSPREMINDITDIARQIFVSPGQRQVILDKARHATDFVREEMDYRRRDGSEFVAYLYMRMLRTDSDGTGILEGFVEDITERKRAEERVREYQGNLEKLVDARTAELRAALDDLAAAKEHAEAADRMKSAFLATMSHELRTPLNSIIGFTGILLQGLGGPVNDEQSKQLTMVKNSANHLLSLISDILDISKIEAGQLTVAQEPFRLGDSIGKVVQSIRPLAEKKGLALSVEVADDVADATGDVRRVEQVLFNLLSNAVKFTEQGEISVRCVVEGASYLTSVTDTGIGIGAEDLAGLFEPFHQIDTGLSRRYEGTGLGLSICKRLVTLMGGSMRVESNPGSGSTFGFTLSCERNQA